jgi:hypothetical protein
LGKVVVWAEECINKTKFSKASDMDNSIWGTMSDFSLCNSHSVWRESLCSAVIMLETKKKKVINQLKIHIIYNRWKDYHQENAWIIMNGTKYIVQLQNKQKILYGKQIITFT